MASRSVAGHSRFLRLITIFSSGFGAASLSLWAVMLNRLGDSGTLEFGMVSGLIAGLAALAGAGSAHAFFVGSDAATEAYEATISTDPTTGLLSRTGLERHIAPYLQKARGKTRSFDRRMLVSFEVDAFRDINDLHGPETGDQVLRLLGARVSRLVGGLGPVARVTGSEFAFVIEVGHDDHELHAVMTALLEEMARPIRAGDLVIPIFCTAGLVELGQESRSLTTALRRTNLARTTAKAGGLGNWAIYHPEMTQIDTYRKWIEGELSAAIRTCAFDLVYQPQVESRTGAIVGYEALLRWEHPEKGFIPPSEFISVAEKCGLINQIGDWVLERACRDATRFAPDVTVAVNVSPKQLETPDFVKKLAKTLRDSGVDPKRIELEITENILIFDRAKVRRKFLEIRELGCRIAIDDFGTGYSNLSYLTELPFSKLKIDQSLVARLEERDSGSALVATIVNMAHTLDSAVLAEGVESEEQVALLQAAGCTLMQGYYFGKPVSLDLEAQENAA